LPLACATPGPCTAMSKEYTLKDVAKHGAGKSVWIVVDKKVYDVTAYLKEHPGGPAILKSVAGTDASQQFHDAHEPTKPNVKPILKKLKIGSLVEKKEEAKSADAKKKANLKKKNTIDKDAEARKKAQAEAAEKKVEEEAAPEAAEEKVDEEEAARKKVEEEAAQKQAEEEEKQKKAREEEEQQQKAEEEQQRKAEEEALKQSEEAAREATFKEEAEARQRELAEELARQQQEEEDAKAAKLKKLQTEAFQARMQYHGAGAPSFFQCLRVGLCGVSPTPDALPDKYDASGAEPPQMAGGSSGGDLPTGWQSSHSRKTGRKYYFNVALNKSQFDKPICADG